MSDGPVETVFRFMGGNAMIAAVDHTNLHQAAVVHSVSWKESHRSFCPPAFIERHSPENQEEYMREKMDAGSEFFLLYAGEEPVGVVSVTGNLIADLYVLPDRRNAGYGTTLLRFAIGRCRGTPTLWILENNKNAGRLYRRMGFRKTGTVREGINRLDEIEYALAE